MMWTECLLLLMAIAPLHANSACKSSNYQDINGGCHDCPYSCRTCLSSTNCTSCLDNYWGAACDIQCKEHCIDQCHDEYGHCTYGCPDGTFGQLPGSLACINCTPNCEICSSASDCIRCRPRHYGNDCQSCSNSCVDKRCDMTTGECLECKTDYFRQNGTCQKCPDGCASCTNTGICSKCKFEHYGPFNGGCIVECPVTTKRRQFLATSEERCGLSKEASPLGPQICEKMPINQLYTCSINRYCLAKSSCPPHSRCSVRRNNRNTNGVCLSVMSEVCVAKCQPPANGDSDFALNDVHHVCLESCTSKVLENDTHDFLCFRGNGLFSDIDSKVGSALFDTTGTCFPGSDATFEDECNNVGALAITSSIGLVATCISVILLILRYKSRILSAALKLTTKTNIEHVTTDLEVVEIPHIVKPTLKLDVPTTTGVAEGMPTPRSHSILWRVPTTTGVAEDMPTPRSHSMLWREEYTAETGMIPLRNLATVHHEERVSPDASAEMTSLVIQPNASREEYQTLGVEAEVHAYQSINTRASYVDCDPIRATSESDVNSRKDTKASRDYITPTESDVNLGEGKGASRDYLTPTENDENRLEDTGASRDYLTPTESDENSREDAATSPYYRTLTESDENSRENTGTSRDYLTPL